MSLDRIPHSHIYECIATPTGSMFNIIEVTLSKPYTSEKHGVINHAPAKIHDKNWVTYA